MTLVFESLARPKVDVAALRKARRSEQAALNCAQWQMQAQQKCQMDTQWQVEIASFMKQHLSVQEKLAEQGRLLQANEVLEINALATEACLEKASAVQGSATRVNVVKDLNKEKKLNKRLAAKYPLETTHQQIELIAQNLAQQLTSAKQNVIQGKLNDLRLTEPTRNLISTRAYLAEGNSGATGEINTNIPISLNQQSLNQQQFSQQQDAKQRQLVKSALLVDQVEQLKTPLIDAKTKLLPMMKQTVIQQQWLSQRIQQAGHNRQEQRSKIAQCMNQQIAPELQTADGTHWLKSMGEALSTSQVSRINRSMSKHDINKYVKYFEQLDERSIRRIADIFAESYAEKVQQDSNQSLSLTASLRRNR